MFVHFVSFKFNLYKVVTGNVHSKLHIFNFCSITSDSVLTQVPKFWGTQYFLLTVAVLNNLLLKRCFAWLHLNFLFPSGNRLKSWVLSSGIIPVPRNPLLIFWLRVHPNLSIALFSKLSKYSLGQWTLLSFFPILSCWTPKLFSLGQKQIRQVAVLNGLNSAAKNKT